MQLVNSDSRGVAIISPITLLERFSTRHHLVLTQYYLKCPKYANFYRHKRLEGDFVILDNGAAELRRSIGTAQVLKVARELKPNVVIAPDAVYDMHATLVATKKFVQQHFLELHRANISIMAVPQGTNVFEWEQCYHTFNENSLIDWLGISMFYSSKFDGRVAALKTIASTVRKPCHLLGLWQDPYTLLEERQFSFVKSVDTAKPVEFALEGLYLVDWLRHRHIDDDWYFEQASLDAPGAKQLAEQNVADFIELFMEGKDARS